MSLTHVPKLLLALSIGGSAGVIAFSQVPESTSVVVAPSFTTEQIILILGAIGVLVGTIATAVVSVLGAIRANTHATMEAKKEAAKAATAQAIRLSEIGAHINGMNTKSITTIEMMQRERVELITQLANAEKRALALAVSHAATELATATAPAAPVVNGVVPKDPA